ncbi:MAG: tRNA (guanosine(18)-2'-O)-methyltransferase TrmH [Gammaproteobacteria bacterium]|nr:tRNA (guanosine(18)-2'-O)-methyltransferase TrmH [Gammaproteobacteria bacterium]
MTPERYRRIRAVLDRRQPDLTVLLDNVHKPHNLSAVLRTCDAVGVFEIHAVSTFEALEAHNDTSAGAGKWVELRVHRDLGHAAAGLKGRGFQIVAAHASSRAVDFRAIDYTRPTAVLLGAEKFGVSEAGASTADAHIAVPMVGMVESLNVSVAAAIILYEAQRQRAAAGLYGRPRLDAATYAAALFRWGYPRLAAYCDARALAYPRLGAKGELLDPLPVEDDEAQLSTDHD